MASLMPVILLSIVAGVIFIVNMHDRSRRAGMTAEERRIEDEEVQRTVGEGW